jgi:thymidylate synthase
MYINDAQIPKFESADEIQHWILSFILNYGEETEPRGMKTLEICPVMFTLLNPRKRCVTNAERRWSFPLALGEFCWHISGSDELNFIEFYASQWRNFAEDDATIRGSCYGRKVFQRQFGNLSQWERIIQILREDSHSRRAVLYFNDSLQDFEAFSKDVPCASSLQFIVREGKVHAVTHMRSNDAIWGLPYDIFLFTMLQELLTCELNLEMGTYSHSVASLHIYERHFEFAKKIIKSNFETFEMPFMRNFEQSFNFLNAESIARSQGFLPKSDLNDYWRNLSLVLGWYSSIKWGNENHIEYLNEVSSSYKKLLSNITVKSKSNIA